VEAERTAADDEGTLEELIPIVRRGLDSGDHLALLGLASATLAIVRHPTEPAAQVGDRASGRVLEHIVLRYVEHSSPEALAFASAMTALVEPGPLRTSLRGALDGVDDELPGWLADIDRARLDTPTVVRDLFDDDEWLLAGVRFVDGGRAAFRVSVDHGAEGAVVDAVLMRQTVDEVRQQLRATAPEDEVTITDVSAAELAERYADAVAANEESARTDTSPSSRPLIEWALRLG
jgi:hypothetical protein